MEFLAFGCVAARRLQETEIRAEEQAGRRRAGAKKENRRLWRRPPMLPK